MILIGFLIASVAVMGSAQEETTEEKSAESAASSGTQFGFGVESIQYQGETWTRVRLFPSFPVWKFRFALDLELYIDGEGNISSKGWDFSNRDAVLDSLARKIYYIQFNEKQNVTDGDDIFYGKVGSLDGVTLGSGIVMNSYRHTLEYPIEKKIGLDVVVGNVCAVDVGLEAMVSGFTDFARGGAVVGTRAFVSPLAPTGIPVIHNLEIGASFGADLNQYGGLKDSDGDDYPDKVDRFSNDPTA